MKKKTIHNNKAHKRALKDARRRKHFKKLKDKWKRGIDLYDKSK